jgi:anaerobic ribonucleoside-triphosphate reductase activating protein
VKIGGFIKTTLLDWEGKVACTIYLTGCDFRCPYCHNRDLVLHPDQVEGVDEKKMLEYIEENSDFLDGAVISGGEALINAGTLPLIKKLRKLGMKIKIDTNGNHPDVLEDLLGAGLVDMVAMDIKTSLNERYNSATGSKVDAENIRRSIDIVMSSAPDYEFRTTVVPIFVKPEDIENICKEIKGAKKYRLHQFRPKNTLDEALSVLDPYPESKVLGMAEIARKYVKDVKIRGI